MLLKNLFFSSFLSLSLAVREEKEEWEGSSQIIAYRIKALEKYGKVDQQGEDAFTEDWISSRNLIKLSPVKLGSEGAQNIEEAVLLAGAEVTKVMSAASSIPYNSLHRFDISWKPSSSSKEELSISGFINAMVVDFDSLRFVPAESDKIDPVGLSAEFASIFRRAWRQFPSLSVRFRLLTDVDIPTEQFLYGAYSSVQNLVASLVFTEQPSVKVVAEGEVKYVPFVFSPNGLPPPEGGDNLDGIVGGLTAGILKAWEGARDKTGQKVVRVIVRNSGGLMSLVSKAEGRVKKQIQLLKERFPILSVLQIPAAFVPVAFGESLFNAAAKQQAKPSASSKGALTRRLMNAHLRVVASEEELEKAGVDSFSSAVVAVCQQLKAISEVTASLEMDESVDFHFSFQSSLLVAGQMSKERIHFSGLRFGAGLLHQAGILAEEEFGQCLLEMSLPHGWRALSKKFGEFVSGEGRALEEDHLASRDVLTILKPLVLSSRPTVVVGSVHGVNIVEEARLVVSEDMEISELLRMISIWVVNVWTTLPIQSKEEGGRVAMVTVLNGGHSFSNERSANSMQQRITPLIFSSANDLEVDLKSALKGQEDEVELELPASKMRHDAPDFVSQVSELTSDPPPSTISFTFNTDAPSFEMPLQEAPVVPSLSTFLSNSEQIAANFLKQVEIQRQIMDGVYKKSSDFFFSLERGHFRNCLQTLQLLLPDVENVHSQGLATMVNNGLAHSDGVSVSLLSRSELEASIQNLTVEIQSLEWNLELLADTHTPDATEYKRRQHQILEMKKVELKLDSVKMDVITIWTGMFRDLADLSELLKAVGQSLPNMVSLQQKRVAPAALRPLQMQLRTSCEAFRNRFSDVIDRREVSQGSGPTLDQDEAAGSLGPLQGPSAAADDGCELVSQLSETVPQIQSGGGSQLMALNLEPFKGLKSVFQKTSEEPDVLQRKLDDAIRRRKEKMEAQDASNSASDSSMSHMINTEGNTSSFLEIPADEKLRYLEGENTGRHPLVFPSSVEVFLQSSRTPISEALNFKDYPLLSEGYLGRDRVKVSFDEPSSSYRIWVAPTSRLIYRNIQNENGFVSGLLSHILGADLVGSRREYSPFAFTHLIKEKGGKEVQVAVSGSFSGGHLTIESLNMECGGGVDASLAAKKIGKSMRGINDVQQYLQDVTFIVDPLKVRKEAAAPAMLQEVERSLSAFSFGSPSRISVFSEEGNHLMSFEIQSTSAQLRGVALSILEMTLRAQKKVMVKLS